MNFNVDNQNQTVEAKDIKSALELMVRINTPDHYISPDSDNLDPKTKLQAMNLALINDVANLLGMPEIIE